ncbi:Lnb N-terminal periplasmic domain-containing protein [Vibrio alfacsensis]|uniref:Lnb N-terminal periplasmic domain-containing protein n=1 Tax=Vibrio alfacsensis TaxID=1074311 RepID=UPI0040683455
MKRIIFKLAFVSLLATVSLQAVSGNESIATKAYESQWLKLIHYEDSLFSSSSRVNTDSFYLSKERTPEKELHATILAFKNKPKAQCQFPARKLWIEHSFPEHKFPLVQCDEYDAYREAFETNSMSLVYASGYLANPASMFGHLLLKFNFDEDADLLDNTFNYGAQVPDNDNKLEYIIKGIFGGYQGRFTNQLYHHHMLTYTESELRDLWEYRLDLSQEQVNFILAHLWELDNVNFTYYFFNENCAYQIAKLLELVSKDKLTPSYKAWVMPIDVIDQVASASGNMVSSVIYHESRQEKLYRRFQQLDNHERDVLVGLISTPLKNIIITLESLTTEEQKRVIDVLYDYYAFLEKKNNGLNDEEQSRRNSLLGHRFKLSPSLTKWGNKKRQAPHLGTASTMIQLSPLYNNAFKSATQLRFRVNYYDLLNINSARVPFSSLRALDTTLIYSPRYNHLKLRALDAINIENINVSNTELEQDQSYAWSFSLGYKPSSNKCFDCSDIYTRGYIGKGYQLFSQSATYISLAAELQFPNSQTLDLFVGPEVGLVLLEAQNWVSTLKYVGYLELTNNSQYQNTWTWEQRFLENRYYDIRSKVSYNQGFEYGLQFSYYW